MTAGDETFHAKIMLFGEYSLMTGSAALVMPHAFFSARLQFPEHSEKQTTSSIFASNQNLAAYYDYLSGLPDLPIRLQALRTDIRNGLFLESDIPSGYGLGSSGALVAAVYERYSEEEPVINQGEKDWMKLKDLFAGMESFFHGSSSGIDPLCIYAGQTLLLDTSGLVSTVSLPLTRMHESGGLFLLDTGSKAATAPLVAAFRSQYKQGSFARMMQLEYNPLNDACIRACLDGNIEELGKGWFGLSAIQQVMFPNMIPERYKKHWSDGLKSKAFALKLCGSGGGGYLLGYAPDYQKAQERLLPHKLLPLGLFSDECV